VLSAAFNTWMQSAQPAILTLVEAVNDTTGVLSAGLFIAAFCGRPGIVSQAREAGLG
jgi:hypothetical protein